jgi:RNA polymerase sigma-70 factor, ECF subfamily
MNTKDLESQLSDAYDEYADAIFRHCYFRLHERELGKDMMQQTFMKTWEYLSTGKEVENMRAFLYRTANNLIIDFVRQQKKRHVDSLETLQEVGFDLPSAEDTTRVTEDAFTELEVTGLLAKIEEPYKTAVILRYIDELSPVEIASSLNISVSNASARISRGMKMLRSLLHPNG